MKITKYYELITEESSKHGDVSERGIEEKIKFESISDLASYILNDGPYDIHESNNSVVLTNQDSILKENGDYETSFYILENLSEDELKYIKKYTLNNKSNSLIEDYLDDVRDFKNKKTLIHNKAIEDKNHEYDGEFVLSYTLMKNPHLIDKELTSDSESGKVFKIEGELKELLTEYFNIDDFTVSFSYGKEKREDMEYYIIYKDNNHNVFRSLQMTPIAYSNFEEQFYKENVIKI